MRKLLVITGQTATGKTSYAVELAKKHKGELINCDSRQIYKNLDVVTGKDKSLLKDVKIHLYDEFDLKEFVSSYQFVKMATKIIEAIIKKGGTPIIVGGTYFYIKHLLYGIDTHVEPDWNLRKKLDSKNTSELQKILKALNPHVFTLMNNSDRNNPRRLMRRIELLKTRKKYSPTGVPLTRKFNIEIIGFRFKDTENLRKQIEKRVRERLKAGGVEEVKALLKKGYSEKDPGLKTIGAKQILDFIKGKLTKEKMIKDWINKEVQYAKRQYVFMKKDKNIQWKFVD